MNGRLFIIDFPTPITINTPPLRTMYAAEHTLLSIPVHSLQRNPRLCIPTLAKQPPHSLSVKLVFDTWFNDNLSTPARLLALY